MDTFLYFNEERPYLATILDVDITKNPASEANIIIHAIFSFEQIGDIEGYQPTVHFVPIINKDKVEEFKLHSQSIVEKLIQFIEENFKVPNIKYLMGIQYYIMDENSKIIPYNEQYVEGEVLEYGDSITIKVEFKSKLRENEFKSKSGHYSVIEPFKFEPFDNIYDIKDKKGKILGTVLEDCTHKMRNKILMKDLTLAPIYKGQTVIGLIVDNKFKILTKK